MRSKSMSLAPGGSRLRISPGATNCCGVFATYAVVFLPISSSTETTRMPASCYTNVLVTIASGDAAKADRSEAAIAAGGAISVQVLNQLTNVARRKMQMSWADTHALPNLLRGLPTVHPVTVKTHETGLRLAERYGFSTYDAMIAASTLHAGCDTLWSEDMQHGMTLAEDLRIINPFRVAS
jgi:predicted nucleic acid-binding protein